MAVNGYYGVFASSLGDLFVGCTDKGLCLIEFMQGKENETSSLDDGLQVFRHHLARWFNDVKIVQKSALLDDIFLQLEQYFRKQRMDFDLPLDLLGTPFQKQVWRALCTIPYGETCSYKDIAVQIGNGKAVRAVGGANNRNPIPIVVPCHRVIGANGALVGYGGGIHIKQFLLDLEQGGTWSEIRSS